MLKKNSFINKLQYFAQKRMIVYLEQSRSNEFKLILPATYLF